MRGREREDRALESRIAEMTVPCSDDGAAFARTDRIDLLRGILHGSPYGCTDDLPLAKVFRHGSSPPGAHALLVSCHVDSLYGSYSSRVADGELRGTFDNSACNALLVEGMLRGLLPPRALVAFTGDEEGGCAGVDQVIGALREDGTFDALEMVVVLDLTEERYGESCFTIENCFRERGNGRSLLRFDRVGELRSYLDRMVDGAAFVPEAAPDESWQYEEHDLNCFSLCLPCRVLGRDMHDDAGVAIRRDSLPGYLDALSSLARAIDGDLEGRASARRRGAGGGLGPPPARTAP